MGAMCSSTATRTLVQDFSRSKFSAFVVKPLDADLLVILPLSLRYASICLSSVYEIVSTSIPAQRYEVSPHQLGSSVSFLLPGLFALLRDACSQLEGWL